jgi:hypothetical protein
MTDISESGIEDRRSAFRLWEKPELIDQIIALEDQLAAAHPPASREEGLREDLGLRDDLLIKAEKFRFGPDLTVESRGPSQWAVCHPGEVLNADGEWEWEPQPSSRTDEFIARTRFTFAEAVKRARALQSKKPE